MNALRDSTVSVPAWTTKRVFSGGGRLVCSTCSSAIIAIATSSWIPSTQTDDVAAMILRHCSLWEHLPESGWRIPIIPPPTPGTFFVDSPYEFFPSTWPGVNRAHQRAEYLRQGTLTHHHGALTFGYEYERQAGVIDDTSVARYDNGFFVNDQYSLTSRISINAGARVQQSSTFGTEFTPRGAITFRLPTDTYFRVSGGRGIKEPELIDNFANTSFYVGNPKLKPETTDSFEAGLFREWFSRRVRTEVSWFRNSFKDLIEFDSSVFPSTWVNIDKSWSRGVEAFPARPDCLASRFAARGLHALSHARGQ